MSTNVTKLPRSERQGARGAGGLHEAIEAARRAQRRATIFASAASVAWVLFALVYISSNGSEGELAGLALPEVAMLIAGIVAPLAVIWLVVIFVRRNADLREHTDMLRQQLDLLTYPAADAELRVRAVAESLRTQAEELNRVTDTATIQMEKLSKTLASRTDSLAEASESATLSARGGRETGQGYDRRDQQCADPFRRNALGDANAGIRNDGRLGSRRRAGRTDRRLVPRL
jgi:hypothetical protein